MHRELDKALFEGDPIDILCIGFPQIIGDAVGPLVGSALKRATFTRDIQIIGTMQDPVIHTNYKDKIALLRRGSYVIVVDATLNKAVGDWDVDIGPTKPGGALGLVLPPVGHLAIKCFTARTIKGLAKAEATIVASMVVDVSTTLIRNLNKVVN